MPKKVYSNVEDHRLIDNGRVVEDVTSVVLPTVEHPTTAIENVAGMAGNVEFPNKVKVNAMELSISHNNGVNCEHLSDPDKHYIEFRTVRMRYNVAQGRSEHESVKYRFVAEHKSTEEGTIEAGNPIGSTEKLSVLRYEKIVDGVTTTLIDLMTGDIRINGKDCTDEVQSMLN